MKLFLLQARLQPAILMRQLAVMIAAGMPITRCFEILESMQTQPMLRLGLYKVRQRLLSGHTLHDSMTYLPRWHDSFSSHLIYFGEQTGKLENILFTLAAYHENKINLQNKVRQALFYPLIILMAALLLLFTLFVFVLPAFADLFSGSSQPLPFITRFLFSASTFTYQHLVVILAVLIFTIVLMWLTQSYQTFLHLCLKQFMHLPPLKHCAHTLMHVYFTRHLGLALNAGIPIQQALQLTTGISRHPDMLKAIQQLRQAVTSGKSLHSAIASLPVFPVLVQQMIKVGEETGFLDNLLVKTADLLEAELHTHISHLTALLEPLIMAILGVLIGGLVVGIYLPVFNLGSTL